MFIKFIKEQWKMIISFLVIIILFPIIILTPSKIGVIPLNIGLEIVSYGGSIIGGLFTLFGVWWTIRQSQESKKEEFSLMYKPIITIRNPCCDLRENNKIVFNFTIDNQGQTEANNIKISLSLDGVEVDDVCFPSNINVLPPKNEKLTKVIFLELHPYKVENYSYIGESFSIKIYYEDSLGYKYIATQNIYIHYQSKKNLEEIIDDYSSFSYQLTNYGLQRIVKKDNFNK